MTDTHFSTDELVIIASYFHQNIPVSKISKRVCRARQTVHNVVAFFRAGHSALDYYQRYKANKQRCGRKRTRLPADQHAYVTGKVAQGRTPDVIAGRRDRKIQCSSRTLYRMFKRKDCDVSTLPMKGKKTPTIIRNAGSDRRSGATFQKGWTTIQRSIKNSAIWRATLLSVCDIKAPSSRWLNGYRKSSSH